MSNDAKIQLSPEEMKLVMEPGWILTKNSIMGKVVALMAGLSEEFRAVWESGHGVSGDNGGSGGSGGKGVHPTPPPKIAKGENYQGLPYVMLDYPRIFGSEDVLAIRTMFWWGHEFSVTLHLKGCYKDLFLPVIRAHWGELAAAGFQVGVSEDEWRHEHVPENYRPMEAPPGADDELERVLTAQPFFKLSARCGLDRWEEAPDALGGLYRVLAGVLRR
jgi:hypothetical protein